MLEWSLSDLDLADRVKPRVEVVSLRAPRPVERKRILIEGSPEEAAQALAGYLSKEGVL